MDYLYLGGQVNQGLFVPLCGSFNCTAYNCSNVSGDCRLTCTSVCSPTCPSQRFPCPPEFCDIGTR